MTKDPAACAPLFLGIEGGATRTVAILADAHERVAGRIESGPANLRLMNDAELAGHFASLARQLPAPAAIAAGLAGMRSEQDRARLVRAASSVWPGIPFRPCSDLETAMAAANPAHDRTRARVLVLSGTGSCCYGRSAAGRTVKIGGWGHWLGDKGSAYEIGLRALKACVYYYDRDGKWPRLGASVLRHLQLNEPEELIAWIQTAQKRDVAAIALEVFEAWQRRDKIASDILQGAAASLAKDGSSCARRLARQGAPVQFILAGSVLLKQPRFGKIVCKQLLERWPGAEVSLLQNEGALGAVRLAQAEWSKRAAGSLSPRPSSRAMAGRRSPAAVDSPTPSPGQETGGNSALIPVATALSPTERRNPRSVRLDKLPLGEAIELMLDEESKVAGILARERLRIQRCIHMIVRVFRQGGRLFYVGGGTSGRLGVLDASECPPTFRVSPEQVQGIIAGGQQALWQSLEGAEDDAAAGAQALRFRGVTGRDVVVGVAASGRTPFVWGALNHAKSQGAKTVLMAFNPHLRISRAQQPDVVLAFDLGPEVLTGSTRLKAGTATKLLLNLLTTLSMVRMGKVVSNLMVDVNPSNRKLRERAVRILQELTSASVSEATQALDQSGWVVKTALGRLRRAKQH